MRLKFVLMTGIALGAALGGSPIAAQEKPDRVWRERIKTLPRVSTKAPPDYPRRVNCPPKTTAMMSGVAPWAGSSIDVELGHAYSEEQSTRQVLFCYYKNVGLLTQILPVGSCQPLGAAAMRKYFFCR